MTRTLIAGMVAALMLWPLITGQNMAGQNMAEKQKKKLSSTSAATVARGKYLVDTVAMCGDCHTPRNERGEPIKEQYLKGMTLDFKPTAPVPVWAEKSVDIAGLPGWEKDAAIRFMMTGAASNGLPPRPPMPQYRFNQQDAVAVVAYLQSLGVAKGGGR
ncbi:MAG: c-type cytochrome [Candidatus Sulfotelmatobacter sp.]